METELSNLVHLFEAYGPGIDINCFSMCTVSGGVADDLQSYIPMVCTNSPANGTHSSTIVHCLYILF